MNPGIYISELGITTVSNIILQTTILSTCPGVQLHTSVSTKVERKTYSHSFDAQNVGPYSFAASICHLKNYQILKLRHKRSRAYSNYQERSFYKYTKTKVFINIQRDL